MTAVEWLANELYEKFEMKGDGNLFDQILKQAKEMEKQQIIDAFWNGDNTDCLSEQNSREFAEQYYNETYGRTTED